jgi:metal iron transporter
VAYIDPGNYSTDVAAGASYRFKLLFIVLMSNIFAILLQSLSIKLGSVTGLNLAEACRAYLPKWLNITLYILAEAAVRIVLQTLIASLTKHRLSLQILPKW